MDFAYDKVFTLTNNTDHSITITGIFARPTPPFSVVATTCQITLPGHGDSCSIAVQVDAKARETKRNLDCGVHGRRWLPVHVYSNGHGHARCDAV